MTDLHDETDKSPSGSPKVEEKSDELLNGTSENEERPVENGDVSEKEEPKAETKKEEDEDEPKEKVRNGKSKEREYDEDNRPWSNNKKNKLDHLNIRREVSNRVKLYVLVDQRVWDDRGTGHVTCVKAPEDIDDEDASPANASNFVVIVRLESHDKNMLESRILMDTVYQKQQDTLIVWSESESCDLALSFQDKSGCEDIWSKICEVQGRDPADYDAGLEDQEESEQPASDLTMPPISVSRLSEVDGLITLHLSSSSMREAMAATMEKEDNMKQLRSTFEMCEDLEHTEGLKLCYSIAKNLFMLNRSSLNDLLINDRNLRHVLGMLEYDPAFPERRKHREFVFEKAKMREVLPISDPELKQKIEKTYRIQYIQDVCLPSMGLFDENLLSVLNSSIFFNRIDIINQLQKDKKLMKELFESLKKEDTSTERRKELVLFLKEFINLHHGLPGNGIQSKENFFKTIMNYDILGTLDPCMKSEDPEIRSTIIDVLSIVVEFTPEGVREHLLKQAKGKSDEDILINRMLRHMLTDRDPDNTSGMQVALILKILFDPENMSTLKSEKNEFLNMFYQRSVRVLTQPLMDNVEGGVIHRDDFVSATRAASVVRLLSFCIEHHPVSMRTYCISTDLLNKFLVLLKSKHKFLSIHALKLLRKVISVKDENYNKYIVREKVLEQVFECFKKNGTRYNLLNSAILQLFDFIKTEDIKPLIKYIVETHPEVIDSVKYVKVFHDLRVKYDQHKDREETMSIRSNETNGSPKSYRKERLEEHWFEEDDEDVFNDTVIGPQLPSPKKKAAEKEETNGSNGSASSSRKTGMELMFPSLVKRKQPVDDEDAAVFGGSGVSNINYEKKIVIKMGTGEKSKTPSPASSPRASPGPSRDDEVSSSQSIKEPSPAPTIRSLVDYDESDSDEDDDQSSVPSSSTGSPEKEKPIEHKKSVDSPEHDDVSSTSGEEKEEELTTPTPSDDDDSMCQKRKRKSSSPPDSEKSETLTVKRTRIEETSQA